VENGQDIRPASIFGSISVGCFDELLVARFRSGKLMRPASFERAGEATQNNLERSNLHPASASDWFDL